MHTSKLGTVIICMKNNTPVKTLGDHIIILSSDVYKHSKLGSKSDFSCSGPLRPLVFSGEQF